MPPLVNTISAGSAPIRRADVRSRVVEPRLGPLTEVMDARRVAEVLDERLRIASTTAGSTGVVALWSK